MPSAAPAEYLPRRAGLSQMDSAAQQAPQYLPLKGGGRRPPTWSGGAGWGSTRNRDHHQVPAPSAGPPPDSICFETKQMLSTSPLQGEVWRGRLSRRVQLHVQLRSTSALTSTSTVRRAR